MEENPDSSNLVYRVEVEIDINLVDRPVLKEALSSNQNFDDFKGGNQGTNFSASRKQYDELIKLSQMNLNQKYWLYAPGPNASKWDECFDNGIMIIGWDELGDLNQYKNREEITNKIKELFGNPNPKHDSLACYEFFREIQRGDIIIAKQGRKYYLGYGIVESDYIYEESRTEFKHVRKVKWLKKGEWNDPEDPDYQIVTKTLTNITKYPPYVNILKNLLGIVSNQSTQINYKNPSMNISLNKILYGPPGTGKTYNTVNYAIAIIEGKSLEDLKNESQRSGRSELIRRFNKYMEANQIRFVTFHQSYSYEDFIQGLRPSANNSAGSISFELKDGIFKETADGALRNYKASLPPENGPLKLPFEDAFERFVSPLTEGEEKGIPVKMARLSYHIVDVTGKSIYFRKHSGGTSHTLSIATLEDMYDKESIGEIKGLRSYYQPLLTELLNLGKSEHTTHIPTELKRYVIIIDEINRANISRVFGELITLIEPDKRYGMDHGLIVSLPSGETFTVPPNLYILGTMNTADKSIALLDIALRRRFEFIKMYPNVELVPDNFKQLLMQLNEVIIKERGPDFQIGHSYFMHKTIDDLDNIMNHKIIPLLYEYFMNDGETINTILKQVGIDTQKSMGIVEFGSYKNGSNE
jgi:5-methylcytosine-specific restriction protein B